VSVPTHPGSALRFSQPHSGFLAGTNATGLFRPATVPRLSPSEVSPRKNRAPLSRPLAPLRSSTDFLRRTARWPYVRGFTDSHALKRSCLDPTRATTAFPLALATDQVPGLARAHERRIRPIRPLHPLRSLTPPASPFTRHPSCPERTADPLLVFCPSRVFPSRSLGSSTRPSTKLEHALWPEDQNPRRQGP